MSKDLNKPIRIIEGHNKIIKETTSAASRNRVSRNVFNALRESFGVTLDARARSRPGTLHHVYEWGAVGDPGSRLFRLRSTGRGTGAFAISYEFMPSSKYVPGSEPHVFVEKARVMEENNPVVIEPLDENGKLSFEYNGQTVVTPGPVIVDDPGGPATTGAFGSSFAMFFKSISKNPAVNAVIKAEHEKVMNAIRKVK